MNKGRRPFPFNGWGPLLERTLPHLLVVTVGLTIVMSWAAGPNKVFSSSSFPSVALAGTPTPTPSGFDCTEAPQGYSPDCRHGFESNPDVSIPQTPTQTFFLAGSNASIETLVARVTGNRPPVADPLSLTTPLDQPVSTTLTGSDPDGDSITFEISVYPRNGSISRSGADLTYTPNPGFEGHDAFAYVANDGHRRSGAVVDVTVGNPTNQAPVIGPLDRSLAFGQIASLAADITDSEGDSVDVNFETSDTQGEIGGTAGAFTYDPGTTFGHDQFYLIADESSGGFQRSIRLVTLQIADPNASTALYDGDPDQGATQVSTTLPNYGSGKFTGINTLLFPSGPHTFYVKTVDAAGLIAKASAEFTIDNSPPTIQWDQRPNQTYIRDNITIGVQAFDDTRVQSVKFEVEAGGHLLRSEFLTQTPYLKQNYDIRGLADGQTSFKFYALDNAGNVSPTIVSTYTVDNNAPALSLYLGPVAGTLINPAGGPVTVSGRTKIRLEGADGGSGLALLECTFGSEAAPRLSSTTSPIIYFWQTVGTPNGAYTLVLHGRDSLGNDTAVTYSNIVIQNNNAPVAQNQTVAINENNNQAITLVGTDVDPGTTLTYAILTPPVNGTLTGTPPNVTYQPSPGYNGTDSFTFTVNDGALSSTGHVDLTIAGVNDPPAANPLSVTVGFGSFVIIAPTGLDPEKSSLTFSVATPPSNGTLDPVSGGWQYTPTSGGTDSFTYVANDGTLNSSPATVSIDIQGAPIDHPPVAVSKSIQVEMGGSASVLLEGSDPDGQVVTFHIVTEPANGVRSGTLPNLTYTPNATFKGADSLVYVANDGTNDSDSATIKLNVVDVTSPTVSFTAPAAGNVSGIVSVIASASDNDAVQSVQLFLGANSLTTMGSAPYQFSWDTTALIPGPYTLKLRATDPSGNATETTQNVTVVAVTPPTPPTVELTNPVSNQLVSGLVQVLARTTGEVSDVGLTIGSNVLPMSPTSPGRYTVTWDTREVGKYPDGLTNLVAKANGPGGNAENQISVTVDNTPPTVAWVLPTVTRATLGLFGIQSFMVNSQDANGIDHVEFWFSNQKYVIPTASNNEFTFLFDTRNYPDGQNYGMQTVAVDSAGNQTTSPIRSFNINNTNPPPSDVQIVEHPRDGSFVTSDADAQIYASFSGGIQLPVSTSNLQVYAKQNGVETLLSGTVSYTSGNLRFNGTIPVNAEIKWVINVHDASGQPLNAQFVFTRMMAKASGGEAHADNGVQGRFQILIPPSALKEDMLVVIDPIDPSSIPTSVQQSDTAGASDQRQIAGPFKTYGRNAANSEIHELALPSTLLYYDLLPPSQADEQTRAIQIQGLDGSVWRPLGTSGVAKASRVTGQVGTRSISVPVSSFSTFRVNSVPVPASGIDGVFCFPSPFSPSEGGTNIQYSLNANSDVTIVIYDLFGNLVRTLHFAPGSNGGTVSNTVNWDGRNGKGESVGNGGYILQIMARDAQGQVSKAKYKVGVVK